MKTMTSEHRAMRLRCLLAAAVILGASILHGAAFALTSREATAVVEIIERLQPAFGRFAYDDGIVEDWFERDFDGDRVITKAGFSESSWKAAARDTVSGFIAALSDAEFQGIFSGLKQGIEKMKHLNAAQKKAVLEDFDEQIGVMMAMRKQGQPFANTVRPLVPRIRALMLDNTNKR